MVEWIVEFHDEFEPEFNALSRDVQDGLLAAAKALQSFGPFAGRPHVDSLAGSRYANMKELRFKGHDGNEQWRVAFAFNPARKAILLVAGDKQGKNQAQFYKGLIAKADARFGTHLQTIGNPRGGS